MAILMRRRGLLLGLASLLAAPAVVRAESLMPVRGELLRELTISYWGPRLDGTNWKFWTETRFLTKTEAEAISPSAMIPGTYIWSNPLTGAPGGHTITKGGIVIPDEPRPPIPFRFRSTDLGA